MKNIELNGVANILILIENVNRQNLNYNTDAAFLNIKDQVILMERYLNAVGKAINESKASLDIPAWHEVRENSGQYPRVSGK